MRPDEQAGSDAELIRRSVAEPEAFGLVFDRHVAAVHAFAERRIGRDLAEEATAETFARGFAARDRYQLGAQVAGTVACGWIAAWVKARAAGDRAAAERAQTALAGASAWPVLRAMEADGAYPEVVRTYADAIAAGGTVTAGKPVSVADSYEDALCP